MRVNTLHWYVPPAQNIQHPENRFQIAGRFEIACDLDDAVWEADLGQNNELSARARQYIVLICHSCIVSRK